MGFKQEMLHKEEEKLGQNVTEYTQYLLTIFSLSWNLTEIHALRQLCLKYMFQPVMTILSHSYLKPRSLPKKKVTINW